MWWRLWRRWPVCGVAIQPTRWASAQVWPLTPRRARMGQQDLGAGLGEWAPNGSVAEACVAQLAAWANDGAHVPPASRGLALALDDACFVSETLVLPAWLQGEDLEEAVRQTWQQGHGPADEWALDHLPMGQVLQPEAAESADVQQRYGVVALPRTQLEACVELARGMGLALCRLQPLSWAVTRGASVWGSAIAPDCVFGVDEQACWCVLRMPEGGGRRAYWSDPTAFDEAVMGLTCQAFVLEHTQVWDKPVLTWALAGCPEPLRVDTLAALERMWAAVHTVSAHQVEVHTPSLALAAIGVACDPVAKGAWHVA